MAGVLEVRIVTPERAAFAGKATEVILPAWDGELGVYPEHDSLLALVRAGSCRVTTSDATLRYVVGRGFAEIGPDRVTLLTDSCEPAEQVDRAKAAKDLAAAEAELAQLEPDSEKYRQAQVGYELARARLDG